MPDLPCVSGSDAVRAFCKWGFVVERITGSHHILKRPGLRELLSIPVHGNATVKPGLLRSQIRTAGMTVEQFVQALRD